MISTSENLFYLEVTHAEFTFYRDELGEADRMVWVVLDETLEAKKVP